MATILAFRAQSSKSASALPRVARAVPADVVIFPGVHYERWDEAEPAKPRSRRSRRRDELDLDN